MRDLPFDVAASGCTLATGLRLFSEDADRFRCFPTGEMEDQMAIDAEVLLPGLQARRVTSAAELAALPVPSLLRVQNAHNRSFHWLYLDGLQGASFRLYATAPIETEYFSVGVFKVPKLVVVRGEKLLGLLRMSGEAYNAAVFPERV